MPTTSPRVNMVVDRALHGTLRGLARKRGLSVSRLAHDLVISALETEEDVRLAALAAARRRTLRKARTLTHEQVWGAR